MAQTDRQLENANGVSDDGHLKLARLAARAGAVKVGEHVQATVGGGRHETARGAHPSVLGRLDEQYLVWLSTGSLEGLTLAHLFHLHICTYVHSTILYIPVTID